MGLSGRIRIREALRGRRDRLRGEAAAADRAVGVRRFLLEEAWPQVPDEVRRRPLSKAERESARLGAKGRSLFHRLLDEVGAEVIPFTGAHLPVALASHSDQALLCVGEDFAATDLRLVEFS